MNAEFESMVSRFNETAISFVIASGQVLSNGLNLKRYGVSRFNVQTLGASGVSSLSFQVSDDSEDFAVNSAAASNWRDFQKLDGATLAHVVLPVTATAAISTPSEFHHGFFWLRLRAGTAAAPVSASAAITVNAVVRPY